MKRIATILILSMTLAVKAEAGEAIVSLYTYHNDLESNFRNQNLGLILRFGDDKAKWNVGAYRNSVYGNSVLVGMSYDIQINEHLLFTPSAGLVTGYQASPVLPYVFPTFVAFNRVAVTPLLTFSKGTAGDDDVRIDWGVNFSVKVADF